MQSKRLKLSPRTDDNLGEKIDDFWGGRGLVFIQYMSGKLLEGLSKKMSQKRQRMQLILVRMVVEYSRKVAQCLRLDNNVILLKIQTKWLVYARTGPHPTSTNMQYKVKVYRVKKVKFSVWLHNWCSCLLKLLPWPYHFSTMVNKWGQRECKGTYHLYSPREPFQSWLNSNFGVPLQLPTYSPPLSVVHISQLA